MGNYSKQREEIIKIIEHMNSISNAEEIYFKVKQKDSSINRSTVYRNLNRFVKSGILIQIPIINGPDRYFYNKFGKDYGFVICEKCGKIHEFICDFDMSTFEKNVFDRTGTSILKNGMLIKGVCDECILK